MLNKSKIKIVQKSLLKDDNRLEFVFQALSDATRLKIFRLLLKQKDVCVTDIANIMGISVPAASHQLKFMEMAGLVKRDRMGKIICYKLRKEDSFVKKILKVIQ